MLSAGCRLEFESRQRNCYIIVLGLWTENLSLQFCKCSIVDISNFSAWIAILFFGLSRCKEILDGYPQTDDLTIPWFQLHRLWAQLQSHSHDPESITSGELFEYISILNQIRNRVDCLIDQYGMTTDFSAIKQWLRNMDRNFSIFHLGLNIEYSAVFSVLCEYRYETTRWLKMYYGTESTSPMKS